MADQVFELVGDLRLKLHDNGDGSYSLVTYGNGGAASTIAASENHVGSVGGHTRISSVTTTADHPHDLTILSDDTIVAAFESSTPGARVYAYAPDGSDMGAWAIGQAALPVCSKVYPLPAPTPA